MSVFKSGLSLWLDKFQTSTQTNRIEKSIERLLFVVVVVFSSDSVVVVLDKFFSPFLLLLIRKRTKIINIKKEQEKNWNSIKKVRILGKTCLLYIWSLFIRLIVEMLNKIFLCFSFSSLQEKNKKTKQKWKS